MFIITLVGLKSRITESIKGGGNEKKKDSVFLCDDLAEKIQIIFYMEHSDCIL